MDAERMRKDFFRIDFPEKKKKKSMNADVAR
jgi:hypothetical protein